MADRLQQLQALLERDPRDTFCLYGIAMEHAKAGRFSEAVEWFDRTLQADPQYAYAYFHKARCQEQAGDVAAATQTLRQGLRSAQSTGDAKAASELQASLEALE